jgi:hypothetical protein
MSARRRSARRWKMAMVTAVCWIAGQMMAPPAGAAAGPVAPLPAPPSNRVYQADLGDFSAGAYAGATERLMSQFEQAGGRRFAPGAHGRAGLKVYAESGAGLATSRKLVRAVIAALERRGFKRDQLFIVGLNAARLRAAGFLPALSEGGSDFEGVPVVALESGNYYDPAWFYDSPVPSPRIDAPSLDLGRLDRDTDEHTAADWDRKSMLPVPLMFDADFWINLPACSDHPVLGVNGALVNATLWNASNTQRFFRSPANGPAAVAEIAAIPELRAGWICTIVSLERYQFIGGPIFNSLYTVSEPLLWLSDDPVLLDSLLEQRLDQGRIAAGFRQLPDDLRLLAYAHQLGLGSADHNRVEWVPVPSATVP